MTGLKRSEWPTSCGPGRLREPHELHRGVGARGDRLLDEDMPPASERAADRRRVGPDGGGDEDGVGARNGVDLGGGGDGAVVARDLGSRFGVQIHHRRQLEAIGPRSDNARVTAPHRAGAHDRHAKRAPLVGDCAREKGGRRHRGIHLSLREIPLGRKEMR